MKSRAATALKPSLEKLVVSSKRGSQNTKKESDKISAKSFTRSQRKTSSSETYKSAITEHVATSNHVINWDKAKIIDQEADKTTRWLKEAIWIRSRGKDTMNKDEGAYKLDRVYDQIIHKRQPK